MKTPCRIKIHFSFLKQREKFSQFPFSFHLSHRRGNIDRFHPPKEEQSCFLYPFKEWVGFSSLRKERNENNLFWAAVGLEVTADSCSDGRMWIKGRREGEGVSCRMEIREWLGIDESPIHRHPLSTFLSIYRVGYGAGLLPR